MTAKTRLKSLSKSGATATDLEASDFSIQHKEIILV